MVTVTIHPNDALRASWSLYLGRKKKKGAQAKQHNKLHVLQAYMLPKRARGGAVGSETALQAVKLRVRFPNTILGPEVDSAPNRTE